MATITIGKKFFRKERDNLYSDVPAAIFRENLQNSIDAGAERINIEISETAEGTYVLFGDDGCGMSKEVLEKVFFSLGETTKDESSLGGFGRARILTCFSMDWYKINTQHCSVKGEGSNFEIEYDERMYINGCVFVTLTSDISYKDMLDGCKRVLSQSQLDCEVVLNGEKWKDWMYRRRQTRELDFGGVYVNASKPSHNRIAVRVKGLYMFDVYSSASQQVIVEIDPVRSREILTVNRDGMHRVYQSNLTQFLAEIAVDKRSALKSRKRMTTLIEGNGIIISASNNWKPSFCDQRGEGQKVFRIENIDVPKVAANISAQQEETSTESFEANPMPASRPVDTVESQVVTGSAFVENLPSVYINDETERPEVRKVIKNFDPRNWVHSIKYTKGVEQAYRKGATYLKLLLVWRMAIEEAVRSLMVKQGIDQVSWMIGWDFSDDAEAMHVNVRGSHAICLNPVDANGNLRYKITSRKDLMALMALAKHEVTHIVCGYHNEDFSSLHTAIDKEFDANKVLRNMKAAVRAVN